MLNVSEGFGSTGAGGGERPGAVTASQALPEVRPLHVFVKETSVETVASADRIDSVDCERRADDAFVASLCESALAASLYDQKRH